MTSFVNDKYGDATAESIPLGTAFFYSFSLGKKNIAQIPFTMRCVQYMVTSVLQDQQYMFGVRSLLVDEKVFLMKKDLADVLFQRLIQRSQQLRLSWSDRRVSIVLLQLFPPLFS